MTMTRLAPLLFLLMPGAVSAHGPTPQKAKESIVIHASPDTVWNAVREFGDIGNWHPDVKKSSGDGRHESGGVRTLTLEKGEIVEELDYHSEKDHEYSYRLKKENVDALPVSSYSSELQVRPAARADETEVILKSRFYRGDTGNTPPAHLTDEAAVKAMTAFFQNGLKGLKAKLEP